MLFLVSCSTPEIKKTDSFFMNLKLKTSNKNKEIILENILEQNIIFSIDFNKEGSYILSDDILGSRLKYFCNDFIEDQNIYLESLIFDSYKIQNKKILIIFSEGFEEYAKELKRRYPDELYFYLDRNNYEDVIKEIFNVQNSIDKHVKISNLDKGLKIDHSPRIRNDISKIYFLLDYGFGKTVVPYVRNYAFKIDSYSSSEIFHEANDIKKLVDFENLYTSLSGELIRQIQQKNNIKSIRDELEKLLINDFLLIEKVYQNNLFEDNITLYSSNQDIQNNNKCIDRRFSIYKISSNDFSNLP
tara:strand:+ start:910 stop:1812 length:903 start_codon:yes stop_codon:yes gene_type:complete